MAYWSTKDMQTGGQTSWLVRLYEKTVLGVRSNGLPSERTEGSITVSIPTMAEQARIMRYRDILPPGHNTPTGVLG